MAMSAAMPYACGQLVEVFSKSGNGWVEANVLEVFSDGSVRVQYGNSQKVVPLDVQHTILRPKAVVQARPSCYFFQGQRVEVYSSSKCQWVAGVVRAILPDDGVHVQYTDAQNLFKIIPVQLQASSLRVAPPGVDTSHPPLGNSMLSAPAPARPADAAPHALLTNTVTPIKAADPVTNSLAASGSVQAPSSRLRPLDTEALIAQSERLKATIAAQQKQISDLLARQQQVAQVPFHDGAADVTPERGVLEDGHGQQSGCWRCHVCTFENIEGIHECEMCGRHREEQTTGVDGKVDAPKPDVAVTVPTPLSNTGRTWRCEACTYENSEMRLECGVCTRPRDDTAVRCGAIVPAVTPQRQIRVTERDDAGGPQCLAPSSGALVRHSLPDHFASALSAHKSDGAAPVMDIQALDVKDVDRPGALDKQLARVEPQEEMVEIPACAAPCAPASSSTAPPPLKLPQKLHSNLREYQLEGVAWMWQLFHSKSGGILGDEMGLGKTVQACTFLRAVRAEGATHALVLLPVTLLDQWATELNKWCPDCPVYIYHGTSIQRARALKAIMHPRGGVLLTSYAIIKNEENGLFHVSIPKRRASASSSAWISKSGRGEMAGAGVIDVDTFGQRPWNVVICDEAHVMRTISTLLGKSVRKISADCRICLTGTPVQNALQDLWSLMDFAQPGLLGNHSTFVKRFNDPIEKGSVRGAGASAVALKKHLCEQLSQLMKPHMLRRTKHSVGLLATGDEGRSMQGDDQLLEGFQNAASAPALKPKLETVIWLQPTKEQVQSYKKVLATSDVISEAHSKTKLGVEVFQAIGLLKRLCNHPALGLPVSDPGVWQDFLSGPAKGLPGAYKVCRAEVGKRRKPQDKVATRTVAHDGEVDDDIGVETGKQVERFLRSLATDADSVIAQSAKLRCLSGLLPALISRGHRVLIFSQGVKMMDLVEVCILRRQGIEYVRIDGQTDIPTRTEKVNIFQTQPERCKCMLLTTRVGGYGLNLTSANRVIIMDPAWNPAADMQAVDRAYRIGQHKEVRTYRLVMSGLIEDKIFRLQVFKMGLTKTALETRQQHRYFTSDEIRGLFEWTDPAVGETRALIVEKHGEEDQAVEQHAHDDGSLDADGWLKAGVVVGLSNFSTLYSTLAQDDAELEDDCDPEIKNMKTTLQQAEQKAQRALEGRKDVESKLDSAQRGVEQVAKDLTEAAEARVKAHERVKKMQAELSHASRRALAAERQTEKALRASEAAREHHLGANENRVAMEQAASSAKLHVAQAAQSLLLAESALTKGFAEMEAAFAVVRCSSAQRGSADDETGLVAAPAAAINSARKAVARVSKSFEAAQAERAMFHDLMQDLIAADGKYLDCEVEVTIASKYQTLSDDGSGAAPSLKVAQAAMKTADKDRSKSEKAAEKAQQSVQAVHQQCSDAVSALSEATSSLADSLSALGHGITQRQVKAVQADVKMPTRRLGAALQAAKVAFDAQGKALSLHRKAARSSAAACAVCKEAQARVTATEREYHTATDEASAAAQQRGNFERDIANAKAAIVAAETHETGLKRKRDELKASLGDVKQSLKFARTAEKEATVGREALYKHYAKANDGIKKELEAAKTLARASVEEQEKALAAIQALKEEEYDANQVVEAYDSKKRPRQEGD